jgi:DNA-binding response OmpR family regulator
MDRFASAPDNPGGSRPASLTLPLNQDNDNGKLVLVIDDSQMIRRIVQYSLAEVAIKTVPFRSGIDAINALRAGVVPVPDLVLLDIGMPHMSGYDVASLLSSKPEFKGVPIVMLSGKGRIIDRLRAKRAGAIDYITKPFEKREFVHKIFALLKLKVPEIEPTPTD